MNAALLLETAAALMVDGKGLLTMNESIGTRNRRFASTDGAGGLSRTARPTPGSPSGRRSSPSATGLPTDACISANAHALARYAALCQVAALVPIVEPEALMGGDHTLERCEQVTRETLLRVFEGLDRQDVLLKAMILKPNMVLPGLTSKVQVDARTVATAIVSCPSRTVPPAVAGITFFSGGRSGEAATERLDAMHRPFAAVEAHRPWPLTFSFGRALQEPALVAGVAGPQTPPKQSVPARRIEPALLVTQLLDLVP